MVDSQISTCEDLRTLYQSVSVTNGGNGCCENTDASLDLPECNVLPSTLQFDRARPLKVIEKHRLDWTLDVLPAFDDTTGFWNHDAMPTYLGWHTQSVSDLERLASKVADAANNDACVAKISDKFMLQHSVSQLYKGLPAVAASDLTWFGGGHYVGIEPLYTVPLVDTVSGNFTGMGLFFDDHSNTWVHDPLDTNARARKTYAIKYACHENATTGDITFAEVNMYDDVFGAYSKTASGGPPPYQTGVSLQTFLVAGKRTYTWPVLTGTSQIIPAIYYGNANKRVFRKGSDGTYSEDFQAYVGDALMDATPFQQPNAAPMSLNALLTSPLYAPYGFAAKGVMRTGLEAIPTWVEDAFISRVYSLAQ